MKRRLGFSAGVTWFKRIVSLVMVVVLIVVGRGAADQMTVGGFLDPGAESTVVSERLASDFETGSYGFVLLLEPKDQWVYSAKNRVEGERLTRLIEAEPGVGDVVSFYNISEPALPAISPLRDFRGDRALIGVVLTGDDDEQRSTSARLHDTYARANARFDVSATGPVEISRVAAEHAERDLQRAELLAAPFTLVGLLLVFRGVRAAVLPLVVAALAVLASLGALGVVMWFTDISIFARTLVTALGLGLAVDYSLLLVARFREERAAGWPVENAVDRTMSTAGRTIAFSAATVGSSLLGLLAFPFTYLRSFAFAGVAVVSCTGCVALAVVPPLLRRYGSRMGGRAPTDNSFWGRQTERVMRRPVLWLVAVVAVLVIAATPFLGLEAGRVDDRVLPGDAPARLAADSIRENMTWPELNPIHVLAPGLDGHDHEALRSFSNELLAIDGVMRVDSALGFLRAETFTPPNELTPHFLPANDRAEGTWLSIVYQWDPDDPRVDGLVEHLRSYAGPAGALLVGGNQAAVSDTVSSVADRVPVALAIVAVATSVLLFFMTGSFVMPLKAIVLNLLSLAATFGAMVWVFQDGHLGSIAGVTATGELDVFTPILMFCVAFGLSMDYEVFVLARVKEEHDLGAANDQAVRRAMGRTGPIVSAAAVLLAIVFAAIATSAVSIVRMFGTGLALAVIADAFLVRGTVTPAVLTLAGRANWWAPRWARRFHLRFGLWEYEPIDLRHLTRAEGVDRNVTQGLVNPRREVVSS